MHERTDARAQWWTRGRLGGLVDGRGTPGERTGRHTNGGQTVRPPDLPSALPTVCPPDRPSDRPSVRPSSILKKNMILKLDFDALDGVYSPDQPRVVEAVLNNSF